MSFNKEGFLRLALSGEAFLGLWFVDFIGNYIFFPAGGFFKRLA